MPNKLRGNRQSNTETTFIDACVNGSLTVVQELMNRGIAPEVGIIKAASYGRSEIIKYMISKNVNVNYIDSIGNVALERAASHGHSQIVKLLVKAGADTNYISKATNYTALTHAASHGHKDIIDFLIANGADCELKNGFNNTAIVHAASHGHLELVKYFMYNRCDKEVLIALNKSINHNYKQVIEFFINQGVKIDQLDLKLNLIAPVTREYLTQYFLKNNPIVEFENTQYRSIELTEYGLYTSSIKKDIFNIDVNFKGKDKGFKIAINNFDHNKEYYLKDQLGFYFSGNKINLKHIEFYEIIFNGDKSLEIKDQEYGSLVILTNLTADNLSSDNFLTPEILFHDEL